jgi:hypothetical protein
MSADLKKNSKPSRCFGELYLFESVWQQVKPTKLREIKISNDI